MAKVNEPIEIQSIVVQLCEALGLDPKLVSELTITPDTARAILYIGNERGQPHVSPAGDAYMTVREFRVRA